MDVKFVARIGHLDKLGELVLQILVRAFYDIWLEAQYTKRDRKAPLDANWRMYSDRNNAPWNKQHFQRAGNGPIVSAQQYLLKCLQKMPLWLAARNGDITSFGLALFGRTTATPVRDTIEERA